jgi:hypothetical protein
VSDDLVNILISSDVKHPDTTQLGSLDLDHEQAPADASDGSLDGAAPRLTA